MNYPAAELRGIKMNFYLINPDAEHRGILLIKNSLSNPIHLFLLLDRYMHVVSISVFNNLHPQKSKQTRTKGSGKKIQADTCCQ